MPFEINIWLVNSKFLKADSQHSFLNSGSISSNSYCWCSKPKRRVLNSQVGNAKPQVWVSNSNGWCANFFCKNCHPKLWVRKPQFANSKPNVWVSNLFVRVSKPEVWVCSPYVEVTDSNTANLKPKPKTSVSSLLESIPPLSLKEGKKKQSASNSFNADCFASFFATPCNDDVKFFNLNPPTLCFHNFLNLKYKLYESQWSFPQQRS